MYCKNPKYCMCCMYFMYCVYCVYSVYCVVCADVTHPFENFLPVVTEHHEQVDLPAGVAVH